MTATLATPADPVDTPAHRDGNVLRWLGGYTASMIGDSVYYIGLSWAAVQTGTPSQAGVVMAVSAVPRAVLMLGGGVIADRFGPRRVVIISDTVRCAAVLAVAGLLFLTGPGLWQLAVLALVFGTVDAVFLPAVGALPARVTSRGQLARVQGMRGLGIRFASVVGGPLGGLAVAVGGAAAAFTFAGVLIAVSVPLLISVRLRELPAGDGPGEGAGAVDGTVDGAEGTGVFGAGYGGAGEAVGADAGKPGHSGERVVGERGGRSVHERLTGRGGGADAAGGDGGRSVRERLTGRGGGAGAAGGGRMVGGDGGRSVRQRLVGRGGGLGAAGRGRVAGEGGKREGRRGGRVGAVVDSGERVVGEAGGGALGPGGAAWQDLVVGLRYIRRHRVLAPLMLAIALGDLGFVGPLNIGLTLLADERGWGASGMGSVLAGFGVGAGAASLLLAVRGRVPHAGHVMVYACLGGAVAIGALAFVPGVLAAVGVALLIGLLAGLSGALCGALLQTQADPGYLGRVTAVASLVSLGFAPLSMPLSAAAIGAWGTGPVFVVSAAVCGLGGVVALCARNLRRAELPM
ncbi:MFS family permease [Streptomyces canus]|uniref:MFS family permease n=1 Tax=Streptomyces canus TaxID=58343 RepID=A0AAW8FNX8_9ACTN|nr:MFS transporter [Streptomyces canus]MDQ0911399.1 MFS family permease [Streptomyces canus]